MGAHDEMAKFQVTELFHRWDNGSKKVRKQILQVYLYHIDYNHNLCSRAFSISTPYN